MNNVLFLSTDSENMKLVRYKHVVLYYHLLIMLSYKQYPW
jgi:hypothetical protein